MHATHNFQTNTDEASFDENLWRNIQCIYSYTNLRNRNAPQKMFLFNRSRAWWQTSNLWWNLWFAFSIQLNLWRECAARVSAKPADTKLLTNKLRVIQSLDWYSSSLPSQKGAKNQQQSVYDVEGTDPIYLVRRLAHNTYWRVDDVIVFVIHLINMESIKKLSLYNPKR